MRLTRPTLIFGLLVLALVLATALFVAPDGDDLPALSVRSNGPNGARALKLWLEALGYDVTELDEAPYQVAAETAALFVLQPSTAFERAEVEAVADWVEGGGRLILMTSWNGAGRLLDRFQLGLRFTGERQREAVPLQPLLRQPAVERAQVISWDANV